MQVAGKTAGLIFSAPAFMPVPEKVYQAALACMNKCGRVIDAGCPVGDFNRVNGLLLEQAKSLFLTT